MAVVVAGGAAAVAQQYAVPAVLAVPGVLQSSDALTWLGVFRARAREAD